MKEQNQKGKKKEVRTKKKWTIFLEKNKSDINIFYIFFRFFLMWSKHKNQSESLFEDECRLFLCFYTDLERSRLRSSF